MVWCLALTRTNVVHFLAILTPKFLAVGPVCWMPLCVSPPFLWDRGNRVAKSSHIFNSSILFLRLEMTSSVVCPQWIDSIDTAVWEFGRTRVLHFSIFPVLWDTPTLFTSSTSGGLIHWMLRRCPGVIPDFVALLGYLRAIPKSLGWIPHLHRVCYSL